MKLLAPLFAAAAVTAAASLADAQVGRPRAIPPGAPVAQVSLRYGEQLSGMLDRYGPREVADLAAVLKRDVELAAGKGGFSRVDLVLEDARPSHPTFRQQSIRIGLDWRSVALGGAIITGTVYRADGASQPLTFSWFETDLHDEFGFSTWYDAERAFDFLSADLARGRISTQLGPGTPNKYTCRGGLDVWCTGV